ncbi:MAG: GAF domain-containing protein [Chloroflexi bacterium]|nr:GAF domain-containing protein [Chloroflexota bacterium]
MASTRNVRTDSSATPEFFDFIQDFVERITRIEQYDDPVARQQIIMLAIFSVVIHVSALVFTLIFWTSFPERITVLTLATGTGQILLPVIALVLIRGGRMELARYGYVLAVGVVTIVMFYPYVSTSEMTLLFFLPVTFAALLLPPLWTSGIALVMTTSFLVIRFVQLSAAGARVEVAEVSRISLVLVFSAALITAFLIVAAQTLQRITRSADRSSRQIEAAAVISDTAATAPNLNALLNVVVERIREAYGFYHSQVFLIDRDAQLARLVASTGRAGEALLARAHALAVGSQSVIGRCTASGEYVAVNDTRRSKTHRVNPLLPDTRAELALPLIIGNEVIGALDVQSTRPNVFQAEDVQSLQIMANQLATTIEKTRLVDQLQSRASENQRLLEDAQKNLIQIEELNRRLTREGWADYLKVRRSSETMGYTMVEQAIHPDESWTSPMRRAFSAGNSIIIQDQQGHIAAIPLRVRGEVIGVLEMGRDGNRPWSDEEIEMAQTLVERLALAIENARLYEQASLVARRERVVNEVARYVQDSESIDQVLRSALTQLGDLLGASRGVVQISPKFGFDPSEEKGNGSEDSGK